jgi:hypothetical protein
MKKLLFAVMVLLCLPSSVFAVNGNCSIFRSWSTGDQLTAGDLTTSFTNVGVTNDNPDCMASHASSTTAIQASRQPLQVGLAPDLTPTMTGEIQSLRGLILRLLQSQDSATSSQWYVPPMRFENHSGGGITLGDVVMLDPGSPVATYNGPAASSQDTPGPRVTTTAVYAQRGMVGVAIESIAHATYGRIAFWGIHHIGVTGDVHVGAYLVASGTAKLAAATRYHATSSSPPAGAFAVALHATAGPQSSTTRHIRALLFGRPPVAANDVINAADHGVRCDGVTDDTASIRSALVRAAHTIGNMSAGNYVDLPAGDCVVSGQLILQNGVTLRGRGPQQTTLHYTTALAIATPAILLGSPSGTALAFNTRLESLQMNLNHVVNIGVFSDRANENSGLYRVRIRAFLTHGASFIDTSSTIYNDNWRIAETELWRSDTTSNVAVGLYLNTLKTGGRVHRLTVSNSNGTTTFGRAGVWLETQGGSSGGVSIYGLNVENAEIGVFAGNNSDLILQGMTYSGTGQQAQVSLHTSGSVDISRLTRASGQFSVLDSPVGYSNTGLRLGAYFKSAGLGAQAFVADSNRTGLYATSIPLLAIHSTALSGSGRRTGLTFMGNGDGWQQLSAPDGTGAPLQLAHIAGGVVGGTLLELRTNGLLMLKNGTLTSVSIGNDTARATTSCTLCLNLFDGTAPVGTLANGISLYSTAGELRVMDSGGTATLLSPHEKGTNLWIFDSIETTTGRRLKIDMEKMMKALNDYMGWNYIHESTP